MEAYIESVKPASWRGVNAVMINFAGYNYRYPGFYGKDLLEFKEEFLKDIREVEKEIDEISVNCDAAIFGGGEPTLQRAALIRLAKHTKSLGLANILITNGSKPFTIKTLLPKKLIDVFVVELPAPLDERFDKVAKVSTFLKSWKEVIKDVETTLRILENKPDDVGLIIRTKVIPGLMYKEESFTAIAERIKHLDAMWEIVRFSPEKSISKVFQGIDPPKIEFIEKLINSIKKKFPMIALEWGE